MQIKIGQTIELIKMNDPYPLPPGTKGKITEIKQISHSGEHQVFVDWENGSKLPLLYPDVDEFKVIGS